MRRVSGGLLLTVVLSFVGIDTALATYPGTNGKIYFSATQAPDLPDVWTVNADGTGLENVTDVLTDGPGLPDVASMGGVTGDGKRLVVGVDSQATAEIWAIDADGTDPLRLTNDVNLDHNPDISADGTKVIWSFFGPLTTDREVWIMDATGANKTKLVDDNPGILTPKFMPNGQTVVMSTDTAPSIDLGVASATPVSPAANATEILSPAGTDERNPTASPDGQSVIFTQDPVGIPAGPFDLLRVGIGGGATTPLVTTPDVVTNAALSPDGTKLVYATDPQTMVIADASGANPVPVPIALPGPGGIGGNFVWAPGPATAVPDTTAPETAIDKKPKKKSKKRKATFRFSSNEAGTTFQCRLDKKPFAACTSPKTYKKLKPKKHTFRVFATDAAGNADGAAAKSTFRTLAAK